MFKRLKIANVSVARYQPIWSRKKRIEMPDGRGVETRNYDALAQWEVLNELIGRVYDSALDPELWNDTLARITDALCPLNWTSAFLIWEGSNPPKAQFVAASGLAAGVQEMYTAVYAGNHDWSKRLMSYRNGSVVDTDELMSRQEFIETPFAKNFLAPWGIDRMVAVLLDRRGGQRFGLMLPGPGDRDLSELKRGLRILAPHIQRASRIGHRLASLELAAGAALEATDHAPFAVLSLDPSLNILAANRRVDRYVEMGIITTAQKRLAFVDPAAERKLIELSRTAPPAGVAFQALDADGREHPVLGARIATQKARQLGGLAEGAALIITIGSSPGETPVVEIDRVTQWFGLTPSESQLAVAIGQGASLQHYADKRAVTINAARFLLKGIFRKTGATTQAQLTAMIARLPS
jgi:DNA-binding CsgD family transcriptional regulator